MTRSILKINIIWLLLIFLTGCMETSTNEATIIGSWEMIYAESETGDSVTYKDLDRVKFIKIINEDHFSFFNQVYGTDSGFYSGAGTYLLNGTNYSETLQFIGSQSWRDQHFDFQIEIKGDTLVQKGIEEVEESGIRRRILEKFVRISP